MVKDRRIQRHDLPLEELRELLALGVEIFELLGRCPDLVRVGEPPGTCALQIVVVDHGVHHGTSEDDDLGHLCVPFHVGDRAGVQHTDLFAQLRPEPEDVHLPLEVRSYGVLDDA
ncbi:hypothetical protein SCMC78_31050 [Streptomyces sp. CMC78]|uniref:Uncharacterized protein n=1 Tax=Streptomyces sp. CMC78 TaxID=3231512 RepID=A0AB33KN87_9ACTN|nr:hypothetical protein [Streptomyces sp. ID01-9D]